MCWLLMAAAAYPASAAWDYREMNDGAGATAYVLQSDSSAAVGAGGAGRHPFIQLRCDEKGGRAYWRVQWFAILESRASSDGSRAQNVRVQARVDGKRDTGDAWRMSRDQTLEGMTTESAPALIKTLARASELKLQVSGGYGRSYEATFDVSGLQAALAQLKPNCRKL
jgi:hypothetical protein